MIIVKNNLDELDKIYAMVFKISEVYGFSQDIQNNLCICIDEIFSNIVKYAYDDAEEHKIKIEVDFDRNVKKITITMIDDGKPFNPLEMESPNLSVNLTERSIGGLGIYIVSNIMNSIIYRRLNNTNRLEMIKVVV